MQRLLRSPVLVNRVKRVHESKRVLAQLAILVDQASAFAVMPRIEADCHEAHARVPLWDALLDQTSH